MLRNRYILSFLAAAALAAPLQAGSTEAFATESGVPASVKGFRITFFAEGARRVLPDGSQQKVDRLPGKGVNFRYGNTSTGAQGGKMIYTPVGRVTATLQDECYCGTSYRVGQKNSQDHGVWTLTFDFDNRGSAEYHGTVNGEPVHLQDVAFAVTSLSDPEPQANPDLSRMPDAMPAPAAGCAPVSLAGKALVLFDQRLLSQSWARPQIIFGRDYLRDGRICNHIVASRSDFRAAWTGPNWVNAYQGESEPCLYPGYLQYTAGPAATGRVQLSGESSQDAFYTLNFETPTSGNATYSCSDPSDEDDRPVILKNIPFRIISLDEMREIDSGFRPVPKG